MGQLLPVAEFTTDLLPPHVRYDAWRNLVSTVFDSVPPDDRAGLTLTASVSSVHFGQALLSHAKADAQHFRRTRRPIAKEGLDRYLIQVYRHGVCDGTYGEVQNTVRPGDVKIVDLAQPFSTFNTDFDNTTLTLPRAELAPLLERPDGLHGMVLPAASLLGSVLGAHIQAMSAAANLTREAGSMLAAGSVRLVAACPGANARAQEETNPYRAAAGQGSYASYSTLELAAGGNGTLSAPGTDFTRFGRVRRRHRRQLDGGRGEHAGGRRIDCQSFRRHNRWVYFYRPGPKQCPAGSGFQSTDLYLSVAIMSG